MKTNQDFEIKKPFESFLKDYFATLTPDSVAQELVAVWRHLFLGRFRPLCIGEGFCVTCGAKRDSLAEFTGFLMPYGWGTDVTLCRPCLRLAKKNATHYYKETERFFMTVVYWYMNLIAAQALIYGMQLSKPDQAQLVVAQKKAISELIGDLGLKGQVVIMQPTEKIPD